MGERCFMFSVGDKVRCINPHPYFWSKVLDAYTIEAIDDDGYLKIKEIKTIMRFCPSRFVLSDNQSPFVKWEKAVGVNETCCA